MHVALRAFGWGMSRLAVVLVATVVAACLAYMLLVFVIVVVQAANALGQ